MNLGGSYIPTPGPLLSKRLVNVNCKSKCFIYSVAACLWLPQLNPTNFVISDLSKSQRNAIYEDYTKPEKWDPIIETKISDGDFQIKGFEGAVHVDEIDAFEDINKIQITAYMYNAKEKCLHLVRTPTTKFKLKANLILLTDSGDGVDHGRTGHWIAAPFPSVLVGGHSKCKMHLCSFCLKLLPYARAHKHQFECKMLTEEKKMTFPSQKYFKFTNQKHLEDVGYKGFIDIVFEKEVGNNLIPIGFSILITTPTNTIYHQESFVGKTPILNLIKKVLYYTSECGGIVSSSYLEVELTGEETMKHMSTTECTICNCKLTNDKAITRKVLHHNHLLPKDKRGEYQFL